MKILRLEVPSVERKKDALEYIEEFRKYNSEVVGSGGLQYYTSNYNTWLKKIKEDETREVSKYDVPSLTYFLVRISDEKIVGMINIRLKLNQSFLDLAGHIGYGIRPTERGKGYNKINLYLGLRVCKLNQMEEVFLDCKSDNIASEKTIKAMGGTLMKEFFSEDEQSYIKRFKIIVDEAVEKYEYINEFKLS